ncbi:uncharacterized protein [Zea mays]|uniref:Uncharacterized protein n=1 Tax=Zea mays TaxID=4577 RepID=A0A1D6PVW1_MAIZE|nr:uncharacterized protein LOC100276817 isoform X1 [Zea mays]AQK50711.1 hypothetical protein ZEAMMB73_Zm00001d049528 [Zea mays]|eukprot:XP_023157951.1 uncharacterized protein LOC100276817 isoform X1 [Zea mays]
MELFPDGAFVRLQSRARRTYVHADGDWAGVSLRPNGPVPPLNAVWRVEHLVWSDQGDTFVLLQNAAYGRYLSFSIQEAPPGHRGRCTTQLDRNEPHALSPSSPWMWRVQRLDPPDHGYVRLRYFGCDLRANGRHRTWNTCVTVDVNRGRRVSTMMQWTAHVVAASSVPPPLPASPQPQIGVCCGLLFWRRTGVHQHPPRTIRHVRASDEGDFDQNPHNWPSFVSYDHSVMNLRIQLGQLQDDWDGEMFGFTLCMRPGSHGRLTPLVTDLPRSLDPMDIVVFRTGSPGDYSACTCYSFSI